jgi:hypothetical protein
MEGYSSSLGCAAMKIIVIINPAAVLFIQSKGTSVRYSREMIESKPLMGTTMSERGGFVRIRFNFDK